MKQNAIWLSLVLIIGIIALWFIAKASYETWSYFQFDTKLPVLVEKWSVEEKKSDHFFIKSDYSYEFNGQTYHGEGLVGDSYPNPWAANLAKEQFAKQAWSAWVNSKHPASSLIQKKFPYKQAISALVLIGLSIYFLILGLYVGVKRAR